MPKEIVKYTAGTRVLHWVHTSAFILLFLTGLFLFIPQLGPLAAGGWTRIVHRVAALFFVLIPLFYLITNWSASWRKIAVAFKWGVDDIGWLKAAPGYYFLGNEKSMPPQDEMNSGQKLWWLLTIVSWVVFAITGLIMWAFKETGSIGLMQWMVLLHDIAFIVAIPMLFVHIYLGVFHPLMKGAWGAIANGTVTVEYAKSHHAKWYRKVAGK
ncbi:MAG: cytochrome b/b6 domain-containing protein [Dehalococcoidales bacterium]|jgi:formate dehydrogenase subunit gamma